MKLDSINGVLVNQLNNNQNQKSVENVNTLELANDMVTISGFSKHFENYFSYLRQEGDEEAVNGLTDFLQNIHKNVSSQQVADFVLSMDEHLENNSHTVADFFGSINNLNENKISERNFVTTFIDVEDRNLQERFASESYNISSEFSEYGDLADDTFRDFVSTTRNIITAEEDEQVRNENISDFFNEVSEVEDLAEKYDVIENFEM
ncbi:MAG: hypothetical protein ACQESP_03025 [Candidatus Muiribacteriota bacterium]